MLLDIGEGERSCPSLHRGRPFLLRRWPFLLAFVLKVWPFLWASRVWPFSLRFGPFLLKGLALPSHLLAVWPFCRLALPWGLGPSRGWPFPLGFVFFEGSWPFLEFNPESLLSKTYFLKINLICYCY